MAQSGYDMYFDKCLFPVTPEKISIKINGNNKTVNLINEGEINILKKTGLTDIEFEAEIPQVKHPYAVYKNGFKEAGYFFDIFEGLKTGKKTFQFIVCRKTPVGKKLLNTNMKVSLEDYKISEDAKNGFDFKVKFNLKQYRDYGTKTVNIKIAASKPKASAEPKRETNNSPAPAAAQTYTVVRGDCLWNIAKRFYGSGAKYTVIYNAIPNKGIHAAYKKLRLAVDTVPEEMIYCLKIDCKKFYPSIDHETLKQKFRRKYKDPELLELIDEVIDSISTCPATDENIEFYRSCGNEIKIVKVNGKDFIEGVGIPIGNYFSQYDGNFFLSGFDHWIKEVKRVKHYYRYMDDICIFARTKEELHQLLAEINEYFIQNLKLRIKGNYQIFPSFIRGIDFVGYRIFLKDTLLRKSTCQEFERKMTAIRKKIESGQEMNYSEWCAINSYKGWLKYCDSSRLSEKYIEPIQPYADRYYKDHIKKGGKKHERVRKSTQYKAA